MDELTTVHDALSEASISDSFGKKDEDPKSIVISLRISPQLKIHTEQICSNHGVTLASYLRKCCEGLVLDYAVKPVSEMMEIGNA